MTFDEVYINSQNQVLCIKSFAQIFRGSEIIQYGLNIGEWCQVAPKEDWVIGPNDSDYICVLRDGISIPYQFSYFLSKQDWRARQLDKILEGNKTLCLHCRTAFQPDKRNVDRGWGLFCGKSCAISYRNRQTKLSSSDRIIELRDKKLKQLGI